LRSLYKRFCQFERRCLQKPLSKPRQRTTATSTDAHSRFSFRIFVSKRPPPTDILAIPLSGSQRSASATGLTTQILLAKFLYPPALRPTLLSVSSCEDLEKIPVSSTDPSQPPLAGILLWCQLRRLILPADPPFEVSVQSTLRSNLHSQSFLLAKALSRAPVTTGSTTIESASRHIPAVSHLSALLDFML
jgi:hypothetical protein